MYTVYKTVCLVNEKFYIGVHKTDNDRKVKPADVEKLVSSGWNFGRLVKVT